MLMPTIFGWTAEQWERVFRWAGQPCPSDVFARDSVPALLEAQQAWLNAGGPMEGPSGRLIGI